MPDVKTTMDAWDSIRFKKLDLDAIEFTDKTKADYARGGEGTWVILDGMKVRLGDDEFNAHITITKKPTMDVDGQTWTYCHFTVVRATANHVFYEVDDAGQLTLTKDLYDKNGTKRAAGDTHYKNDAINDAALRKQVEKDLKQIFLYLV